MGIFTKNKKKNQQRAVVVGLDGVPYSMLRSLKQKGLIPNMAKIFNDGYFGQMSVCIPEISSVSWSSFMTGTQSGEHGIFGFIDLSPGTYKMYFPNFSHLKAQAIWKELEEKGKKTVVINMPATYPAREINGALISGFVAIDLRKAVYPTSLASRLQSVGYRIDVDNMKARKDPDFLFRDLETTLESRERAVEILWNEFEWDLFIVVVTGTDRLMHFLWDAYEDEQHPYHQHFLDYFGKVDSFVGKVYDRFQDLKNPDEKENKFYMLSDHGFTGIKSEVYLNRWLHENGYLKFNKAQPETIMDIGSGSIAFALDPSRVYINLKNKYPMGTVSLDDYENVRQEIKQGLEALTFEGNGNIIKKVYMKEELYQGPYAEVGPDLVALSQNGYDLKGKVNSEAVFGRTSLSGMHSQDNAFFFGNSGNPCHTIFNAKQIILQNLM